MILEKLSASLRPLLMDNEMLVEDSQILGLYTDAQVESGVKELFGYEKFVAGMQQFLPKELSAHILSHQSQIKSSFEFQRDIVHPLLQFLKKASMQELSCSGLEQLNPEEKYLFISNHRDIGLDSAFLNLLLFDNGFSTSQIAIGDNLMKHRVAELIFRINKSFVVQRSGGPRELYRASVALSEYIKSTIASKQDSIWIAQREGRAKDGNDRTQIGVLKMLGLSKEDNLIAHFKGLNIVPVSISYEYDPCDYLKAQEFNDRRNNPDYKKSFQADMASILQGLRGRKGKVHVAFGKPLNEQLTKIAADSNAKKQLEFVASSIDQQIHQLYRMNPINYIAADLLENSQQYQQHYSPEDHEKISNYFDERLVRIEQASNEFARKYLYSIYANPLKNTQKD